MPAKPSDGPGVKIIPPLIYIAGLAIGLALSWWFPLELAPRAVAWSVGFVLIVCGAALAASAIGRFRRAGTTVRPDRAPAALVLYPPYTFTRNPMYLGLAIVYAGIAIAAQSLWALLILPVVLAIIRRGAIDKEEAFLAQRFGADYLRYKEEVRRWI